MGAIGEGGEKAINEDEWSRKATQASIDAVMKLVKPGGYINPSVHVGRLSQTEWGLISCASIFGWIETRAQQAVYEGSDLEVIAQQWRPRDPSPWESGAVIAALPAMGNITGVDWAVPVGSWTKDQMVSFVWQIYRLVDASLAGRNEGAVDKIVRFTRSRNERETTAANGGPLMDHEELSEEIPF